MNRCARANVATGGAYECRREADHDGPCAAELVRGRGGAVRDIGRGEYEDRCTAMACVGDVWVRCTLAADHEEDHRAAFEWPGTGQR